MEDQIISFETAKLAREKGFPQENYYLTKDQIELLGPRIMTQSLLQKWLREEHDIMVYLVRYDDGIYPPRWSVYIYSDKIKTLDKSKHHYICGDDDYENGLEIGLFEALKLI